MVSNINHISVSFELSGEEMNKLHSRIMDDLGTMPKFIEKILELDDTILSASLSLDDEVPGIQVDIDFVGSMADVKSTIKKIRMLIESFTNDKR